MKKLIYNSLINILPCNDTVDKTICFLQFVFSHKRLPKKRKYFNDVLYEIKSSDEILNPLRQFVSDKQFVKDYIRSKVGNKYNVPTLGVCESFEDLKSFNFPSNCCIKPTHASQRVILRKNAEDINIDQTEEWFSLNYYYKSRERNYKYLKPKVIIEPLIFESKDLVDYRFFCYDGKVKLICIDIGKYSGYKRVFYNTNWEKQGFSLRYPLYEGSLEKPENLDEMIFVAEKLSEDLNFIRVDIYSNGKSCLVGEITNCHAGGNQNFLPASSEKEASILIFGESK